MDATHQALSRARVWASVSLVVVASGCGERFHAAPSPVGDSGAAGAETEPAAGEGGTRPAGGSGGTGGQTGGAPAGGRPGGGGPPIAGVGGVLPLGGSGGSLVTPAVPEEGLELWLDASIGVEQDSGGVSEWQDLSRHERHAFQDEVGRQPLLVAQALNGKPAVVFDGDDDLLNVPALTGDFSAGVTIFAVGRTESSEHCMAYFEASNGPEEEDVHLGFWEGRYLYEVADPYLSVQVNQVLATPEVVVGVQQPSGEVEVRRNGKVLGTSQFELPVLTPRDHVYVGYTEYVGCTVLNGRISELLVYSRGMSAEELQQVEGYLQQKWACCGE